MVETGIQERMQITFFRQFKAVGQQPADLAVLFGVGDQVGQIFSQSRFAAGERNVRHPSLPGHIQDLAPLFGGQFAVDALGGGVFGFGFRRKFVSEGTVQSNGSSQVSGMRRNALKVQV